MGTFCRAPQGRTLLTGGVEKPTRGVLPLPRDGEPGRGSIACPPSRGKEPLLDNREYFCLQYGVYLFTKA